MALASPAFRQSFVDSYECPLHRNYVVFLITLHAFANVWSINGQRLEQLNSYQQIA